MKFIEANHPVHPITKRQFSIGDRVEVKEYLIKLMDPCGINKLFKFCFKKCRNYKKFALKGGFSGEKEEE